MATNSCILPYELISKIANLLGDSELEAMKTTSRLFYNLALSRQYRTIRMIIPSAYHDQKMILSRLSYDTSLGSRVQSLTVVIENNEKKLQYLLPMESYLSAFATMTTVSTLSLTIHPDERYLPIPDTCWYDDLLLELWRTAARQVTTLYIGGALNGIEHVHRKWIPATGITHLRMTPQSAIYGGDLLSALAPIVKMMKVTLQSLIIELEHNSQDISPLIDSFGFCPHLAEFQLHGALIQSDPDILGRFLFEHSGTLKSCHASSIQRQFTSSRNMRNECHWLNWSARPEFLSNVEDIELSIKDPNMVDFGIGWLITRAHSLHTLKLDAILQPQNFSRLCLGFQKPETCVHVLKIIVDVLQPCTIKSLYNVFPHLIELTIEYNELADDKDGFGKKSFIAGVREMDLTQWKIRKIVTFNRNAGCLFEEVAREDSPWGALIDRIPSVDPFSVPDRFLEPV